MIKILNLCLGKHIKPKKQQTTILRSRVALACIEDADIFKRMVENKNYQKHFLDLKKCSNKNYYLANGQLVRAIEGDSKMCLFIQKNTAVLLNQLNKNTRNGEIAKKAVKINPFSGYDIAKKNIEKQDFEAIKNIAEKTSAQHTKNYETLKTEYDPIERIKLRALVSELAHS